MALGSRCARGAGFVWMKRKDGEMKKVMTVMGAFILIFSFGAPSHAASIENFDTDPGWTRFNNPANSNDFGFQNSNLAGGDPKRWRRNIRKVHYWRG